MTEKQYNEIMQEIKDLSLQHLLSYIFILLSLGIIAILIIKS